MNNLLEALNSYISYEAVKTASAEKVTLKLKIDGPNHELSMTEAETDCRAVSGEVGGYC